MLGGAVYNDLLLFMVVQYVLDMFVSNKDFFIPSLQIIDQLFNPPHLHQQYLRKYCHQFPMHMLFSAPTIPIS